MAGVLPGPGPFNQALEALLFSPPDRRGVERLIEGKTRLNTAIFIFVGAGILAVALLIGFKLIRLLEFDRVEMWAAVADWAHANEQAARRRVEMRRLKPWREWAKESV